MSGRTRLWVAGGVVATAAAVGAFVVLADDTPTISATLRVLADPVTVSTDGASATAVEGQRLGVGDTIRTGDAGRAVIEYSDGSITRLDHATEFTILTLGPAEGPRVVEGGQTSGNSYHRVVGIAEAGSRFDVATPSASATVQGTIFAVFVAPDGSTTVAVVDGAVEVAYPGGVMTVTAGFMVTVGPDGSIVGPVPIPADSAFAEWIAYNLCELDAGSCDDGLPPPLFDHLDIVPTASEIVAGDSQQYSVTAVAADGAPLGDLTADALITGPSCAGDTCAPTVAGAHVVTAAYGGRTATATLTVIPGPLAALQVTPQAATVAAGSDRSFTAAGVDALGNPVGIVDATFDMEGGTCSGASCGSTVAGEYPVAASYEGFSGEAMLTVAPGPLTSIEVLPATATVTAGTAQVFSATGYDEYGNSRGDLDATFTIGGDECDGSSCSANSADEYPIVASFGGITGTAGLRVVPGPLAFIVIYPQEAAINSNDSVGYTAIGYDRYSNYRGEVAATYGIAGGSGYGWCEGSTCRGYSGTYTVTGSYAGFSATATIIVTNDY